ncbi:FadR/GntR family transcriptional regulator [Methylobacterium oryzisoli]|uniref:FadR/GntR family transcriptional regulator n=1 Tax=Methylobacterium oryzisoli TaxID=3385502 RepID=UPI003891EDD6
MMSGRRRVQEALLDRLIALIVSGHYPESATLPNERELALEFNVSRTALREAMQFLNAQGMVRSRTRAGTVVLPRENWNLLEPTILGAAMQHGAGRGLYPALLEARMLLEPEAAAKAAERATARQLSAIEDAYLGMVAAESRSTDDWSSADLGFHTAIIEASGNPIYRQFGSAIRAALLASFQLTNRITPSHAEVLRLHHCVLDAIRLRRPAEARQAMVTLIAKAQADLKDA